MQKKKEKIQKDSGLRFVFFLKFLFVIDYFFCLEMAI